MKKRIGWIQISMQRYGGNIYGDKVIQALLPEYEVERIPIISKHIAWRYLKPLEWIRGFLRVQGKKDYWITQSFLAVAAYPLMRTTGKKMALIYHLDNTVFGWISRPFFYALEHLFYVQLRKADTIVTISEYWRQHFIGKGYSDVRKVYPGFDMTEFNISEFEVEQFREKYALTGRPIIYIGNCIKAKGVVPVYEALKGLPVNLVTSGKAHVTIGARNLELSRHDYLCLLKASTLAITMSLFKEGWNMTAHEAMLSRTPVVGSGTGGMRELLEGGSQIICDDFGNIKTAVQQLLADESRRNTLADAGYEFAKQFTMDRFNKDWKYIFSQL
jgi:glycosyltransferase involved in cell wall biosynthesis